jgi:NAD(P)-dependent dehydrogenase (short-subunit alcohol dehydrogenase family)
MNAGVATDAGGLHSPMDGTVIKPSPSVSYWYFSLLFFFLEDESERLIHDINVGGVIKGDKVAIMHLMKRKGGVIINTASIAGIVSGA